MRFFLTILFLSQALFASELVHENILQEVTDIYGPLANVLNQSFQIEISDSPLESASAYSDGKNFKLILNMGLVNNPQVDEDVMRLISCHELGHTHGGAPRRNIPVDWNGPIAYDGLSYAGSEGQSDYYASAICFRKLIKHQVRKKKLSNIKSNIISLCDSVWGNSSDNSYACQRAIVAAEGFLQMHIDLNLSVSTPDKSVAENLIRDSYPSRQCRLDTFVNGALCKSHKNLIFDFSDSRANECKNPEGKRPLCWYKE